MHEFEAAGVAVFALSYDEPEALAAFAAEHDITFTLLSDPDSEVIRQFGILNTLIPPDDNPWHGIPFPGIYVTDADGIIRSKFFEGRLAIRTSPDSLLRAVRGEPPAMPSDAAVAEIVPDAAAEEVEVRVWTNSRHLAPGIVAELSVELALPTAQHVYGQPVPDGMVATSVDTDDSDGSVIAFETVFPPTHEHVLDGTGETLQVFDGDAQGTVRLIVPFMHNGSRVNDAGEVTLSGTVRWQACDDVTCSVPGSHRFELRIPAGRSVLPHYPTEDRPLESGQMDSTHHLGVMRDRRR